MSVTLFRQTKLADSLVETLDTLVNEGKIPGKLALRILHEFDKVVLQKLEEEVTAKANFKGQLDVYRYCDNVWTFVLSDATFKMLPTLGSSKKDEQEIHVEQMKMVLVDSKVAGPT